MVSLAVLEGFAAMTKVVFAALMVNVAKNAADAFTIDIGAGYIQAVTDQQKDLLNNIGVDVDAVGERGVVCISPSLFERLSPIGREFVIGHEEGHAVLHFGSDAEVDGAGCSVVQSMEVEADQYAVKQLLAAGYSKAAILAAIADTFQQLTRHQGEQLVDAGVISDDQLVVIEKQTQDGVLLPRISAIMDLLR